MLSPRNRTSPPVGSYTPVITLNTVVLPAPFGPITPTMPPGGSLKVRLSISRLSPKPLVSPSNSTTFCPSRSATGMTICAVVGPFSLAFASSSS